MSEIGPSIPVAYQGDQLYVGSVDTDFIHADNVSFDNFTSPTIDSGSGDLVLKREGVEVERFTSTECVHPRNLNMNSHLIKNVLSPSDNQDAATKKYVDDRTTVSFAPPVRVVTTDVGNGFGVTATTTQIDGVTLAVGDRVLHAGSDGVNIIWTVMHLYNPAHVPFPQNFEVNIFSDTTYVSGMMVPVLEGTVYADSVWMLTTSSPFNPYAYGVAAGGISWSKVASVAAATSIGTSSTNRWVVEDPYTAAHYTQFGKSTIITPGQLEQKSPNGTKSCTVSVNDTGLTTIKSINGEVKVDSQLQVSKFVSLYGATSEDRSFRIFENDGTTIGLEMKYNSSSGAVVRSRLTALTIQAENGNSVIINGTQAELQSSNSKLVISDTGVAGGLMTLTLDGGSTFTIDQNNMIFDPVGTGTSGIKLRKTGGQIGSIGIAEAASNLMEMSIDAGGSCYLTANSLPLYLRTTGSYNVTLLPASGKSVATGVLAVTTKARIGDSNTPTDMLELYSGANTCNFVMDHAAGAYNSSLNFTAAGTLKANIACSGTNDDLSLYGYGTGSSINLSQQTATGSVKIVGHAAGGFAQIAKFDNATNRSTFMDVYATSLNNAFINQAASNAADHLVTGTSGWIDLPAPLTVRGGPSAPNYTEITNGFYGYEFPFNQTKTVYCEFHIPHNYDVLNNTGMYFHVHCTNKVADGATFQIDVKYAVAPPYGGTFDFSTARTTSIFGSISSLYGHAILETTAPVLSKTIQDLAAKPPLEVDSVVMASFTRNANQVGSFHANSIYMIFADAHIQVNKFTTKNRNKAEVGGSFYA